MWYDVFITNKEVFMSKKLTLAEVFESSHGEIVDGKCSRCGAADLDSTFCLGVTNVDDMSQAEADVVREVGVRCEECGYYYHCDDLTENEFYTVCDNCTDQPYSENVEPLTRDWVWAAANDMLEVQG